MSSEIRLRAGLSGNEAIVVPREWAVRTSGTLRHMLEDTEDAEDAEGVLDVVLPLTAQQLEYVARYYDFDRKRESGTGGPLAGYFTIIGTSQTALKNAIAAFRASVFLDLRVSGIPELSNAAVREVIENLQLDIYFAEQGTTKNQDAKELRDAMETISEYQPLFDAVFNQMSVRDRHRLQAVMEEVPPFVLDGWTDVTLSQVNVLGASPTWARVIQHLERQLVYPGNIPAMAPMAFVPWCDAVLEGVDFKGTVGSGPAYLLPMNNFRNVIGQLVSVMFDGAVSGTSGWPGFTCSLEVTGDPPAAIPWTEPRWETTTLAINGNKVLSGQLWQSREVRTPNDWIKIGGLFPHDEGHEFAFRNYLLRPIWEGLYSATDDSENDEFYDAENFEWYTDDTKH